MNIEEKNYLALLQNILDNGSVRQDRTGIGTVGLFGTNLRFSLENDTIPLLTTKKVFWKGIVEELLFFVRGEIDSKKLEAKGVNIWKGNTSREFLDKRGLSHYPEGMMGPMYGYQWRNFGKQIFDTNHGPPRTIPGIDQLQNAFNLIKNDPNSRRIIVTAYNPQASKDSVLEPCHMFFQLHVDNGELSLQWYQRSVDSFLGLPFNIASYALLTHMMAKATGLKAKELIFSGGDTHVYSNHIEQVKTQLTREPFAFPKLQINKNLNSLQDIEKLELTDLTIEGYQSHPAIKAEMAV